jgi:hypothetical protein
MHSAGDGSLNCKEPSHVVTEELSIHVDRNLLMVINSGDHSLSVILNVELLTGPGEQNKNTAAPCDARNSSVRCGSFSVQIGGISGSR